jgi:hypothetical protein
MSCSLLGIIIKPFLIYTIECEQFGFVFNKIQSSTQLFFSLDRFDFGLFLGGQILITILNGLAYIQPQSRKKDSKILVGKIFQMKCCLFVFYFSDSNSSCSSNGTTNRLSLFSIICCVGFHKTVRLANSPPVFSCNTISLSHLP